MNFGSVFEALHELRRIDLALAYLENKKRPLCLVETPIDYDEMDGEDDPDDDVSETPLEEAMNMSGFPIKLSEAAETLMTGLAKRDLAAQRGEIVQWLKNEGISETSKLMPPIPANSNET